MSNVQWLPPKLAARRSTAVLPGIVLILCVLLALGRASAQEEPAEEAPPAGPPIPLIEQEPFDMLTLDEANDNAVYKVEPIPLPGRKKPLNPDPRASIRVRIIDADDDGEYEIFWRNIKRLQLFEEMLLAEAEKLTAAKQYDEAFDYYYRIQQEYPGLDNFDLSYNRFLYLDAVQLTRDQQFTAALGVVEELYRRDSSFKYSANAIELTAFMGRLLDQVVNVHLTTKKYGLARSILQRVEKDYGANAPESTQKWVDQLIQLAVAKRDEARQLLEAKQYREALRVSKEMIDIWPDVEGARQLDADLSTQYPMVLVGVLQPALTHNSQRLDSWPSRRTGKLVHRSFVEFLGAGPEGGQYQFALGLIERSDDQRQLILRLNPQETDKLTGFDVARRLLAMADPGSPEYVPAWGGLVSSVEVQNVMQVNVNLRRPHVLPEALLRVPLLGAAVPAEVPATGTENAAPATEGDAIFRVDNRTAEQVQFVDKDFAPGGRLAELVEITYENSQQALSALRRGDIDVVDRLFPADAIRVREELSFDSPIVVEPYGLPTVHMLVLNEDNPFLANRDFRRALIFALDRNLILKQELLGGNDVEGCRVISGPLPAGANDRDPLSYAYDATIDPRQYTPRLAKLLTIVAQNHIADMAKNRGEDPPELKPFVLGHPAHEAARVASQAIAAQLALIGIECTLKEFPAGLAHDPEEACDLTYAEIAIWEPIIDARRLLGEKGLAPTSSPYVNQVLRWLDQAQNWGEARERLLALHRTTYNELTVIPLWQTVDFFAYNKRIKNVGENPVWIYQNIDQWRVGVDITAE